MSAEGTTPPFIDPDSTEARPHSGVGIRTANVIAPDHRLRQRLLSSGGEALGRCMQCATCSTVCALTPRDDPFPRKEMLWAQWGLRQRLVGDADLWLCHECHECTLRCPRGARPGDVMAALRIECLAYHSVPRVFGHLAARPQGLPWFVLVAALLLGGGIVAGPTATGAAPLGPGERIALPFWPELPRSVLAPLFGAVALGALSALALGLLRFWRALEAAHPSPPTAPSAPWARVARRTVRRLVWHEEFAECRSTAPRRVTHTLVVYGMLALFAVDLWVITAPVNPLLDGLVYPWGPLQPWKVLANLAGLAVAAGCVAMARDRFRRARSNAGTSPRAGTYSDWLLLSLLFLSVGSGLVTELLHLLRADRLRIAAYVAHLITVLTLFLLLPYSKLAHVAYRALALLFTERRGVRSQGEQHPKLTIDAPASGGAGWFRGQITYRRAVLGALVLALVPPILSVYGSAFAKRKEPFLSPAKPGTRCVQAESLMRTSHPSRLLAQRDRVVRSGLRPPLRASETSGALESCAQCHGDRDRFCDRCHVRAGVRLDCFECHHYAAEPSLP